MVESGFAPKSYYSRTGAGEQRHRWGGGGGRLYLVSGPKVITRARAAVGRDTCGQRERNTGGGGREGGRCFID